MKKALFIGRFQPFHLGHLNAIKRITEDDVIIGVGSSQYSRTDENFWSFEERKKMIDNSLADESVSYEVIPIPDIHDEKKWVDHVVKIIGDFDVVYTGNMLTKKLFDEKKYKIKMIDFEIDVSGAILRALMKAGNEEWKKLVPKQNINFLCDSLKNK